MAGRALATMTARTLTATAFMGGSLFAASPAFADTYPNITPGQGVGAGIPINGGGGGSATAGTPGASTGGGSTVSPGSLPFTGAELLPILGLGGLLLASGSTVLVVARRRKPTFAH